MATKKHKLLVFVYLLLGFSTQVSYAQNLAIPDATLFVHFDKNVYSNNETVYFTGYLTKVGRIETAMHNILAVALIRTIDSSVVATYKFGIIDGLSFGSFDLPDSIQTGDYSFLAYTNCLINGIPDAIFRQNITLKTNIDPSFKASAKLLESNTLNHAVLISVLTSESRFMAKALNINYKYGRFSKKVKTDATGQLLLNIPKQDNLKDPNLYIKIKNQKDSSYLTMALPQTNIKALVKFYPEGGNAVIGIPTTIGWEVKNSQLMPIALKAFLFKNEEIIDTIETNSYGMGTFQLAYKDDAKYTVKLIQDGLVDSVYLLPKAITKGIALNLTEAVAADTLKLTLKTNAARKVYIRIHNSQKEYLYVPFEIGNRNQLIKIPLNDLPKGLATITITDSLKRPFAERVFFAHYDSNQVISIETDRPLYRKREKVTLKLETIPETSALVSIAVVQENRLTLKNATDIESYSYLQHSMADLPSHLNGNSFKDKIFIEQMLLIKGWRKYNWISSRDTLTVTDSLTYTAIVTRGKKEIKSPVTLGAFGNGQLGIGTTTTTGRLNLNSPAFISTFNKKLSLFVSDKDPSSLELKIVDEFAAMSPKAIKFAQDDDVVLPSNLVNNAILVLNGNEKAIRLKKVEIKSRKDDHFNYSKGSFGANECGDYVCVYNILNCGNHRGDMSNTRPVNGVTYRGSNGPYHCRENQKPNSALIKLDGIYTAKDFYQNDYADLNEPAFFSTIYWNYGTVLAPKKPTEITFFTSDIVGKYRIVVQGITDKDVVYAAQSFEVK